MSRNVLITGASSGLGKATAILFAKKGDNIIINYNNHKQEAELLKEELEKKYNIKALSIKADITKEEEIEKMIKEITDKFNTIDVLVNNAGVAIDTTFEDKTKEIFQTVLEVNLLGTFLVSKYVSKIMKKGTIINISSNTSINSYYPYGMDYDASKAGINLLTKNLAIELAPYIRVNAVAPGWINTPMNKELDEYFKEEELKKIALKRFAEPEEIANIIYFLSMEESSYINGSIIIADGGKL